MALIFTTSAYLCRGMNIVLFDNSGRMGLYPLTLTRAIAELRTGIFTGIERWQEISGADVFVHTEKYLQPLYNEIPAGENLWIDAAVLADSGLAQKILSLTNNTAISDEAGFIAGRFEVGAAGFDVGNAFNYCTNVQQVAGVRRLQYPWQIFKWNDAMIRQDIALITSKRALQPLPETYQYINAPDIYVEEGAQVNYSILNASTGPIYIGKDAVIMEGSLIRGPFALCEGSVVKMGTKIYGATTIGPYSVAGGEIKNSVIQAYSNKGHDGYLGDAVIGQWCNLGAATSNSNVKNTGGDVKMWSYAANDYVTVGPKAGAIMGDYTRTAINTSLNTGTVAGVCCNIFDGGLLPKHIRNFSWGGSTAGVGYKFEKALADIANWKKMKHTELTDAEKEVLKYIFEAES